jgi:hypothetical protein
MRAELQSGGDSFGAAGKVVSGMWWKKEKGVIIRPVS